MGGRTLTLLAGAGVLAAGGTAVALSAGSSPAPAPSPSRTPTPVAADWAPASREDCSSRSLANFPGAFTDPRNLVVGPLVLVGGGVPTSARTVREYGGNKFPLLVRAGHSASIRVVDRPGRPTARLGYGRGGATRSVMFVACRPGRESGRPHPDGRYGSFADGEPVTFWSGFITVREPACVALDVHVDAEPAARRVLVALGRRCAA